MLVRNGLDLCGAGLGGDIADALSALSSLKRLDMRTQLEYLDISASGICPPEDEQFSQWLLGITFTGNDDICEGESEATDEADNVTGGGWCVCFCGSAWSLGGTMEILLAAVIPASLYQPPGAGLWQKNPRHKEHFPSAAQASKNAADGKQVFGVQGRDAICGFRYCFCARCPVI